MADDLGWNDVSFHGSSQVPTHNIDALAMSGIILNRHYVQPVCTPTRAALMSSKYPITMGLQGQPFLPSEMRALPPMKILPEYLRDKGYATHAVGKWHLGYYKAEMTPTYRGFDSHLGYWNGLISYFEHVMGFPDTPESPRGVYGYDMRANMSTAWNLRGRYATDIFTERAEKVIAEHDPEQPLFLYMAHLAVHAGNTGQLLEAPIDVVNRFPHIDDPNRRTYAAMVAKLDESVGRIVSALQQQNMLKDSLILFMSDNGAPTFGEYQNWGSNYPLRGIKDTLWEGGVRGAALLWGPMLSHRSVVSTDLIHVTDWLPTFYSAAGGQFEDLPQTINGVNQWEWLIGNNISSPREEILVNIDERTNVSSYIYGRWKLVQGKKNAAFDGYYGDSGVQEGQPRVTSQSVWASPAGLAVAQAMGRNYLPSDREFQKLYREAIVRCPRRESSCDFKESNDYCLFDVLEDPCELHNVAEENSEIADYIKERIDDYGKVLKRQMGLELDIIDANPRRWGGTWTPWGTCNEHPTIDWCNKSPGFHAPKPN